MIHEKPYHVVDIWNYLKQITVTSNSDEINNSSTLLMSRDAFRYRTKRFMYMCI